MKKDDETVKLIADTLREGLTKFVGSQATQETAAVMKDHMFNTLKIMGIIGDFKPHIPKIEVSINGNEATFSFRDPKTDEPISISQWLSRSYEGFYE
jgi:hypothetical protein